MICLLSYALLGTAGCAGPDRRLRAMGEELLGAITTCRSPVYSTILISNCRSPVSIIDYIRYDLIAPLYSNTAVVTTAMKDTASVAR
jgi:hypothetical protein